MSTQQKELPKLPKRPSNFDEVQKGIKDLKKRYALFMHDFTPKVFTKKKCGPFINWKFKYEKIFPIHKLQREIESLYQANVKWMFENLPPPTNPKGWCNQDYDDSNWTLVTIPERRGPCSKWFGWYRTNFKLSDEVKNKKRIALIFEGVQYKAWVWLNGKFLSHHTGSFESFEFDITNLVNRGGINQLTVRVFSDDWSHGGEGSIYSGVGAKYVGQYLDEDCEQGRCIVFGDTVIGGGIWQPVYCVGRDDIWINDIFTNPRIKKDMVSVTATIHSLREKTENLQCKFEILPKNFKSDKGFVDLNEMFIVEQGENYYYREFNLPDQHLWSPENPYLYIARIKLYENGVIIDSEDITFGQRSFEVLKHAKGNKKSGTLYLNGREIFLRGTNSQAVFSESAIKNDREQIIYDILLAKLTNCNYLRIAQEICPQIVYDYCDMLGILVQADFPLSFSVPKQIIPEAVRQAGAMAEMLRNHPSVIMFSLINEAAEGIDINTFLKKAYFKVKSIHQEREVKLVEGSGNPFTGIPDIHLYCGWYEGQADYLPDNHLYDVNKFKAGWRGTIGEWGGEGLDSWETMQNIYPKRWYPNSIEDKWDLSSLPYAQWQDEKNKLHLREIPKTCREWIDKTQEYQARIITKMGEAIRRMSEAIVGYSQFYLIDIAPCGWLKAIVSHDRYPKKAYYSFMVVNQPLLPSIDDNKPLGTSRRIECGFWICNDYAENFHNYRLEWYLLNPVQEIVFSDGVDVEIEASSSKYFARLDYIISDNVSKGIWKLILAIRNEKGNVIAYNSRNFELSISFIS